MKPFAIRSNITRAEQRPPLWINPVDGELLAALGFKKRKPLPRPPEPGKAARQKKGAAAAAQAAPPPPVARSLPATQPPAKPAAVKPTPFQPPADKLPVDKPPVDKPPFVPKRPGPASPQQDLPSGGAQKKEPVKPPPGTSQPAPASSHPPAQKPPEVQPPQGRRYPFTPPPRSDNRFPGKGPVIPPRRPVDKTPSPENAPAGAKNPPVSYPPANGKTSHLPAQTPLQGDQPAGPDGAPPNGKAPHLPPTRSVDGAPKPPGANGSNGTNGGNGSNGNGARGGLFRPGTFANLPVVRVPPRGSGSSRPPAVQIPMEVYNRTEGAAHPQPDPSAPPAAVPPAATPPDPKTPTLQQLLRQNQDLPVQAAVLGVCEDGLPVLLDLHDPAPGGLLVIGDERESQLEMLRTALASLTTRSSPRAVQFIILSCEPQAWQAWVEEKGFTRYCLAVESADADVASDWIIQLADWTEQRRLGLVSGPSVLLVMDTLSFLPALPYDIRLNFEWMAKEGPPAHIWPMAVISTDLAKALSGRRMLRAFHTQIMGYANQPADYVPLAGVDPAEAQTFGRHGSFCVKAGDAWLRFRLPER